MIGRPVMSIIVCVAIALTGCHTMNPVDFAQSDPAVARLAPNDHLRVWMRDGRTLDVVLTAVEPDALVSEGQRLPARDISRIERRDLSWTRTTLLLVGVALVFFIAASAAKAELATSWQ